MTDLRLIEYRSIFILQKLIRSCKIFLQPFEDLILLHSNGRKQTPKLILFSTIRSTGLKSAFLVYLKIAVVIVFNGSREGEQTWPVLIN